MPRFLEDKLKAEYPNNPRAVYATLNKMGAMKGPHETAKGRAMEAKHERDMHPKMKERAGMVAEAHKHLGAAIPGFHGLPGRQKMQAAQMHVDMRLGKKR